MLRAIDQHQQLVGETAVEAARRDGIAAAVDLRHLDAGAMRHVGRAWAPERPDVPGRNDEAAAATSARLWVLRETE